MLARNRVTGHAAMRLMERTKYAKSMTEAEKFIQGIAHECIPLKSRPEYFFHKRWKVVLVAEAGRIVTVLGKRQIRKLRGKQKLEDGTMMS